MFMKYFIHNFLGCYYSRLQGDVIITRIQTVQMWLVVPLSLQNN